MKQLTLTPRSLFAITIFVLLGFAVHAQNGFKNPYQTIYNHLDYLQDDTYDPAASAQSFPASIDSLTRIRLAKRMKQIYDGKGLYVNVDRIPKDSLYRDSTAQDFMYFPYPDQLPNIFLERQNGLWTYSARSSKRIPEIFRNTYPLGLYRLVDMTPGKGGNKFLGLYTWQYLGIFVLLAFFILLYFLLSKIFNFIFSRTIWRSTLIDDIKKKLLHESDGYLTLSIVAYLAIHTIPVLRLPIRLSAFLQDSARIVQAVFLMLLVLKLADVLRSYLEDITAKTVSRLDEQLVPILIKFLKIVVVIIAIFRILQVLDINVTALIAGISIGGLALALAAQDTVKNLLGSMMIFFDKPFQIGDYIQAGDIEGSVVEVGFRSTRIKKPDTSVITVPNAKISDSSLTNLGVRNLRMLHMTIGLMYNTPPAKIKTFIDGLKEMVADHPRIAEIPTYIHLNNLASSSIDIFFRCYLTTQDYAEELALKEDVIFKILTIAEDVGVSFAFPSSSVYIEQMPNKN